MNSRIDVKRLKEFYKKLLVVQREYSNVNTPISGVVVEFESDFPEVLK